MNHVIATSADRPVDRPAMPASTPAAVPFAFEGIVGESRSMRSAIDYVGRLAEEGPGPLLLVGPSGTGKSLFARAYHYAGPNAHQPFLSVHARATSDALLETELFGYEAGAFEGAHEAKAGLLELAGSGTVFIEDIGALPARLQPKLLKALTDGRVRRIGGREEYEVRCSIVVSASRPLEELVAGMIFRDDLFRALNARRVSIPALRDRTEDIVRLAEHFLADLQREQGLLPLRLGRDAVDELVRYEWPGNVRELRTVLEAAVEIARDGRIHAEHLSIQRRESWPMLARAQAEVTITIQGQSLRVIEAEVLRRTLHAAQGDQATAAQMLGISAQELADKLREHGLTEAPASQRATVPAHR